MGNGAVKGLEERIGKKVEPSRNVEIGVWEGTVGGPQRRTG